MVSTPTSIVNISSNSTNTPTTSSTPNLIVTQPLAQTTSAIFLVSTMDPQSMKLDMIKCPWCDKNFEHIDIMTGHLMR